MLYTNIFLSLVEDYLSAEIASLSSNFRREALGCLINQFELPA